MQNVPLPVAKASTKHSRKKSAIVSMLGISFGREFSQISGQRAAIIASQEFRHGFRTPKSHDYSSSTQEPRIQAVHFLSDKESSQPKKHKSVMHSSSHLDQLHVTESSYSPNLTESLQKSKKPKKMKILKQRVGGRGEAVGACIGEFLGTCFLIVIGCGSGFNAYLNGVSINLWETALIWACTVSIACFCTGSISGAHLNPAISFANSLFDRANFPWSKCLKYVVCQILGAMTGALFNLKLHSYSLTKFEMSKGIIRNQPSGVMSAALFGLYFPNPCVFGQNFEVISVLGALGVEAWATMILMLVIRAVNDEKNTFVPDKQIAPVLIGLTVALLIMCYSPYTMLGMNPARDFGPRFVAYFASYGKMAIPGPRNGFWIYILGPLIGASFGAFLYDKIIVPLCFSPRKTDQTIKMAHYYEELE
eukprot:CAMPEP_0117750668 /NCGR_PEP_ID=MMETSP0947-20121206/10513_1 /TAXON_ID=44440 /ORGANISM="Chattonella subsalsa, Strain CCMP2191" /LENGTH=420 /DNA_ID=CAMNT_0005568895 /DNA_START=506 /DNA_END=1768 /DNA_ORIENTATION=+